MRTYIPPNSKLIPKHAKKVFQGVIFAVWQWEQEVFDGSMATFEMISRPDTTVAIVVKNENIVLIEEEQPHVGKYVGLPGGRADRPKEDELAAIQREVAEELGMTFKSWKLLEAHQITAKLEQFYYVFLGYDFDEHVEQMLDAGERVTAREVSLEEFKKMYLDGDIRDVIPEEVMACASIEELIALQDLYPHNRKA